MHYTSIENIHKVIDPLFLDDLREEFEAIKAIKVSKVRNDKAEAFRVKLSKLTFFDPACGSGNFLTETYISLRRIENRVIRELYKGQSMLGVFINPVKVGIHQFYGIEINDFAVTVAKTALWIAEAQMLADFLSKISFFLSAEKFSPLSNIPGSKILLLVPPILIKFSVGSPK